MTAKPKEPGVQVIPSASAASATFVVSEEDHTLGNSLRYAVMRNPDVIFCGYSMPHPSEEKVNIRIQTKSSATAEDAFRRGLADLGSVADHIKSTFLAALESDDKTAGGAGGAGLAAAGAGAGGAGGLDVDEDDGAAAAAAAASSKHSSKSKRR